MEQGQQGDRPAQKPVGATRFRNLSLTLTAVLMLAACGGGRMTEDVLPGGIPARTDLHRASTLPPESVRGVSRRDFGWRVMYHPARAPQMAEQQAAQALCRLESRRAVNITHIPRTDPTADPGLRIIDVYCS